MKIIKEESKNINNFNSRLEESAKIEYNEYGWFTDEKGDTYFRDINASKKFNQMLFDDKIDTDGNLL